MYLLRADKRQVIDLNYLKVASPGMVANCAGFPAGTYTEHMRKLEHLLETDPRFRHMLELLWPELTGQLEQLKEVYVHPYSGYLVKFRETKTLV